MAQEKSTRTPDVSVDIAGRVLRISFSDPLLQPLEAAADRLSPDIAEHALMHGLKQKLIDAAAISRNPETGRSASVVDKYEAIAAVWGRLLAGQWNKAREGGAGGGTGGLLLRALVRMYAGKKTETALREYLAGRTDAEKAALRKNPKVARIIEEIRAESADDSGIDSDALLDGIDGMEG